LALADRAERILFVNSSPVARARRAWTIAAWSAALLLAAAPVRAQGSPWDEGRTWMSIRAGYAANRSPSAGHGGAGYGIGFSRMLSPSHVNQWSVLGIEPLGFLHWTLFEHYALGTYTHYDVLGRFGSASEIEIPMTLELTRHFGWKSAAHPYLGVGGGWFYRKSYGTGSDSGRGVRGLYLAGGFNAPIADRQTLGLDVRLARLDSENRPANPVFGAGTATATHVSIKLNYAIVD
jgi:outer membrane protein W